MAIHRSRKHKMIAGVCGGIAVYVVGSILSVAFPGILVYVVLWIVMPKAPD